MVDVDSFSGPATVRPKTFRCAGSGGRSAAGALGDVGTADVLLPDPAE